MHVDRYVGNVTLEQPFLKNKFLTEKKKKMVKFIKSVPFILKRMRHREGGREEDNASSIVGMKKTLLCSGISLPCTGIH